MRLLSHNVGRWTVLGIAFTAIVIAAPHEQGDTEKSVHSPAPAREDGAASTRASQHPQEVAYVELERLKRPMPEAGGEVGNVFGATSWYVPPPPPPPAPPPVPTAPPLPFTYLGRYEDAPTSLVILVKGDRMYTVSAGDVIEDTYRIELVTPAAVELTYLPLNIKQSLRTGEAS